MGKLIRVTFEIYVIPDTTKTWSPVRLFEMTPLGELQVIKIHRWQRNPKGGIYMPVDGPAALYAKPSAGKQSSVAVFIEDQHLKKGYVVGKLTAAQGLSRSFNQLAKVTKRYRMSSSHSTGWITIAIISSWWRHQIATFFALLAICAGNSPVTGEFPAQRPVTQGFDVFFDLRLNKQLSKQS